MPACHWMLIRGCWRCIDGVSKNRVHVECNTKNGPYASIEDLANGVGNPLMSAPSRGPREPFVSPEEAMDSINGVGSPLQSVGGYPDDAAPGGGNPGAYYSGGGYPGGFYSGFAPSGGPMGFGGGGTVFIRQTDGEIIEVDEREFIIAYVTPTGSILDRGGLPLMPNGTGPGTVVVGSNTGGNTGGGSTGGGNADSGTGGGGGGNIGGDTGGGTGGGNGGTVVPGGPVAVPEPTSVALFGVGVFALMVVSYYRQKRRRA